jgi:hypothetical protein
MLESLFSCFYKNLPAFSYPELRLTNTYWYLTGIPQLMAVAAERFESFTQMPEVNHD